MAVTVGTVCFHGCRLGGDAPATARSSSAEFAGSEWDDGMALVSTFRGRVRRYGVWRAAVARDYQVREFLSPVDLTKRDVVGAADLAVLKANRMLEYDVGTYGYRFATSLFFRRDDGSLMKGVGSCHNGCGVVFQRWDAPSALFCSDSYFEHEGQREWSLSPRSAQRFFDELPFVARSLAHGSIVRTLPPLASARAGSAPLDRARELRVRREANAVCLVAVDGSPVAEFVYDVAGELVGWTIEGEEEFVRVARFRGAYWQRTAEADGSLVGR